MDFFSNLDLDVVLNITLRLSTDDILRCLRVCKGWSDMLRSKAFDPFWKRACEEAGLTDPIHKAQQQKVASFYELFLIARRFGRVIASHTPQLKILTGSPYPFDSTMNSEHAGQGYFVKHIDMLSVENKETVIGKYDEDKGIITKMGSKPGTNGWILWSGVSARNVLWATTDGVWFGFEIDTGVFYTLLPYRKLSLGHEAVGCCENCLSLAIASVESKLRGNVFSLQLLRLEPGMETPVEWKHEIPFAKGLASFMPKPVSALVVSEGGVCSSHLLTLQSGYCVAVYRIEYSSEAKEIKLSVNPLAILNPYSDSDIPVMVVNNTSRLTISRDKKFLGMLTSIAYPYHSGLFIHLWSADTFKRVSSVKLDWAKGEFNDPHLLSLGGLYSAIAVGHSQGCLKIVSTRTGKVFMQHSTYARALQSVLPFIFEVTVDYIGVLSDACLNDLTLPLRFKMLFRDSRGRDRANMRMLQFNPPRGQNEGAAVAAAVARDNAGNDSDS